MPIILGAQASNARWNKTLLIILWTLQLIVVIFLEFMAWFIAALDSWGGASSTTYVTPSSYLECMKSNLGSTIMLIFFITNILLLCSIGYEFSHLRDLDHMSARRYYRIQLVKSLYFGLFILIGLITWLTHPTFDVGPLAEFLLTMMFPT